MGVNIMKKRLNYRLQIIEFSLMGMKFIRGLTLIFLGVDIALRYHIEGIKQKEALIAICFTAFGIYGFLSYFIRRTEKYLNYHQFKKK